MTEADIEALRAHLALLRQDRGMQVSRQIRVAQALQCAKSRSYVVRAAAAKTLAEEVMQLHRERLRA